MLSAGYASLSHVNGTQIAKLASYPGFSAPAFFAAVEKNGAGSLEGNLPCHMILATSCTSAAIALALTRDKSVRTVQPGNCMKLTCSRHCTL